MKKQDVVIKLKNGLEARPVALLVQVATQFESRVYLQSGDKRVNAKSIMGMMTLILAAGDEVTVSAEGEDEEAAVEAIVKYLSEE
ncbi:MAG: HPr family phosphocarrier protein [Lachnospiraceae bacterium]|nr:HPr family phosphocarrier protein [Lachnospiraceae bacterium]MBQ7261006.1 HPr family phosphocarrier protein [Lachnospiraceae bacterium]HAV01404.1 HPr family phosphocarrier protein [Lachnospiraceae bacterium]